MSTQGRLAAGAATILVIFALGGAACVTGSRSTNDAPSGYGISFYEPFDNSRDWGPGYLAGPPHATKRYDNDHGGRGDERSLVQTDTNGTAPSVPDATRVSPHSDPSSPAASANEPTNGTPP